MLQTLPPPPQASLAVPGLQTPFSQQPLAQLLGLQVVEAVHSPAAQSSLAPQLLQAWPPAPQASTDAPVLQTPLSQQPEQLVASQAAERQL